MSQRFTPLSARDGVRFTEALARLTRPVTDDAARLQCAETVAQIRARIAIDQDQALLKYTAQFDGHQPAAVAEIEWRPDDFRAAFESLDADLREALEVAAGRIDAYAQHQKLASFSFSDSHGSQFGQQVTPLQRVGVYVPGGQAAYPSSVLMNAVPARVAEVEEVVMVSPTPGGEVSPVVLAAAHVAGVHRGWAIGGAPAIAALALGTESIPRVDKIVGPGNQWVAEAKRQVYGEVGIDLLAGPSEILIISDSSADPQWLAADLMAQAEHDPQARAALLSPDGAHLQAVADAVEEQLGQADRADIIRSSLTRSGALLEVDSLEQAIELANTIAPEHLQLAIKDADFWQPQVRNAGAIFIGGHSPEVIGDYCAGPNHVLPTAATARFASPLGVYDFQKRTSLIQLTETGADHLAGLAERLARAEGLTAHAKSARFRKRGQ